MPDKPEFGALFDIDGVLIDSIPIHLRAFDLALEDYGVEISQLSHDHSGSSIRSLAQSVESELGVSIDDVAALSRNIDEIIIEELGEDIEPDPHLISLLDELKERSIPCAIGTSAVRPMAELKVRKLGIKQYFQGLVCAEEVDNHKPYPDVYLAGAKLIGVSPDRCVVIDDAEAGVEAGNRAGMKTVGFTKYNIDGPHLAGADMVVSDWGIISYRALKSLWRDSSSLS